MRFSLRFSGTKPFFYHIINIMWYFSAPSPGHICIVCTIALSAKSPGAFRCFPEAYLHRFEQRSDTGAQENRLRTRPGIFHKNYEHFVNKADFCRMILYNVSIRQRLLPLFFRVSVSASFSRCTTLYRLWLCFAGIRAVSGCDRLIIFI